jgi:hypothetical protein
MTKLYLVRDGYRIYKTFLTAEEAEQIGNMPNCDIAFVSDVMYIGDKNPKDDEITHVVIKDHTFYFINVWKGVDDLYCIFDDFEIANQIPVTIFQILKDDIRVID